MKIKLVILCQNQNYLNRLAGVFSNSYANRVESHFFTKKESAEDYLRTKRTDVFLLDQAITMDLSCVPAQCGFAYLTDSPDVTSHNGEKAICKYQSVDQIYSNILAVFAEVMPDNIDVTMKGEGGKIITCFSPAGGVGTTTVAIAFAKTLANQGKNVIYVDLTGKGDCTDILKGAGYTTFSDVIFALEDNGKNMAVKVESCIRKDPSGVCFFQPTVNLLDMNEFNGLHFERLVRCLESMDLFDYMIFDLNFSTNDETIEMLTKSFSILMVTDGELCSNKMLERGLNALETVENDRDLRFGDQLYIIYNRFLDNSGYILPEYADVTAARIPDFYVTNRALISDQISMCNYLNQIEI